MCTCSRWTLCLWHEFCPRASLSFSLSSDFEILIKINIKIKWPFSKLPQRPFLPSRKRHVGLFRVFFQIEKKNKNKRSCCSSIIIIIWNDWNLFFSPVGPFWPGAFGVYFKPPTRKETPKHFLNKKQQRTFLSFWNMWARIQNVFFVIFCFSPFC